MSRAGGSPDLDPLFESAKGLERVSDVARARVRARARATVAAASASTPFTAPVERRRHFRIALAVGAAFVLGATGAAAALLGPSFLGRQSAVPRTAPAAPLSHPPPIADARAHDDLGLPGLEAEPVAKATTIRHHRRVSNGGDARVAELALIQKAQAAYADGNLPGALALLAEHSRRFPKGRLAEEREALRVRSLASCGRPADARRALQAFAERYPHSVLLPHLRETLGASAAP